MQIADKKEDFERNWDKLFGKQRQLALSAPKELQPRRTGGLSFRVRHQASNAVLGHYLDYLTEVISQVELICEDRDR